MLHLVAWRTDMRQHVVRNRDIEFVVIKRKFSSFDCMKFDLRVLRQLIQLVDAGNTALGSGHRLEMLGDKTTARTDIKNLRASQRSRPPQDAFDFPRLGKPDVPVQNGMGETVFDQSSLLDWIAWVDY